MQIKTTHKKLSTIPKSYVRLVLLEKGTERFVENDGVSELHLVTGKFKDITPRLFRALVRNIVQTAKRYKISRLAVQLQDSPFPKLSIYGDDWVVKTLGEDLLLADYTFDRYKSKKPKQKPLEVLICGGLSKSEKRSLERGKIVAESSNFARDIANTPGGDMTPALLAKEAQKAVLGTRAIARILSYADIKRLKMGGVLGVGQGAKDKPRFIILEYWGAGKPDRKKNGTKKQTGRDKHNPVVFVGKGITFDTGGLQIKPGMAMYEMHMDMSGGAAVIGAIRAAAKLGLKKNIVGLIPAAENAVSDEALRPGDVITTMSGKTVDVLHTDAEGRLVLADGLYYARRYNPRLLVDVATLTGAAAVALGQHAHAILTKDRKLEDRFRELGEESGDYVHPLPLWEEYVQYLKGVHADITNIPSNDMRFGGTITAGTFLSHFTKGMKWVHIDMAPRMTAVESDKLARGATGEPVRLLVNIAEKL